ncbi:sensor histidine kinase [Salinimicrobium xinjiangense]|uniref:sensor histidine kinase n=1 Tax=Salinimicrobium xinjiangense TaxID=438596 RepID=UPI0003F7CB56|nr:histidine kinase [Salinimicrobium xinjiangense]
MKTTFINQKKVTLKGEWLQRIGVIALISLAIHIIATYITYGELSSVISLASTLEIIFTFIYFLSLFWLYPKISGFVHSPRLKELSENMVNFVEGFLVVISTFLLTGLTKIFPLWVLLLILNRILEGFNGRFDFEAVRRSLIIHAFLGLFFYYFVERERLRKKIRAEHLRFAQLQSIEFKNQLERLKNRVNPDFLFKSLDTLDSLIEQHPEKAVEFVGHLSSVYRSFLNTNEQLIKLKKELELAGAYIAILKVQYGANIRFSIDTEPESLSLYLPPGTLQVLIENAGPQTDIQGAHPLHVEISTTGKKLIVKNTRYHMPAKDKLQKKIDLIKEKYEYFSNETVEVEETDLHYKVEIPLLELNKEVEQ